MKRKLLLLLAPILLTLTGISQGANFAADSPGKYTRCINLRWGAHCCDYTEGGILLACHDYYAGGLNAEEAKSFSDLKGDLHGTSDEEGKE